MSNKTRERIKALQKRIGAKADGIVGPATLTRLESIADKALGPLEKPIETSLTVSKKGLEQIVKFEISSNSYYERFLSHPIWPGGASGITIGIGYDLGYNTQKQAKTDWEGKIPDAGLEDLLGVVGKKGESAKELLNQVQHITIGIESAREVFYMSTLSRYARMTRKAYPGIEDLPADAQAMLLSLVFNRGSSMSGDRRREMKLIQPLVKNKDLNGIAEQIRAMKRLWDKEKLPGLHIRRDKEASLITSARTEYEETETISL